MVKNDTVWDDLGTKFVLICFNSQNGKFSYGYASSPGKRSSMEDFYETRIDGVDGEVVGLFGVFDGIYTLLFPRHLPVMYYFREE